MREKLLLSCAKKLLILSFIVMFFGYLPAGVYATDGDPDLFWVRIDGNDTCSGQNNMSYTENLTDCAWASITKAGQELQAGQKVRIQSGTYYSNLTIISNDGNSTDWIIFKTDGNVIMDGGKAGTAFTITARDYIVITGIKIQNYSDGIFSRQPITNLNLTNLTFENMTDNAIDIRAGSNDRLNISDIIVRNTTGTGLRLQNIHNSTIDNVNVTDTTGAGESCVYLQDTNRTTLNNIFVENCKWSGLQLQGFSVGSYFNVIENWTVINAEHSGIDIHNNASHNRVINSIVRDSIGTGIFVHNERNTNNTIINSEVYNISDGAFSLRWAHNISIYNSTAYDSGWGLFIRDGGYNDLIENFTAYNNTWDIELKPEVIIPEAPDDYPYGNNTISNSNFQTIRVNKVSESDSIIDPKSNLMTITIIKDTPDLKIRYTDGRIFTEDGSNTPYWFSDESNITLNTIETVSITAFDSTLNTTGGNTTVTLFSTTGMILDYYSVALDYVNFTLADNVFSFNITLLNVPSGTTLSLKYANGTLIDAQVASNIVYFNDSLSDGSYYIEKEPDTIPPTITFIFPTDDDGANITTRNWTFINVLLSEVASWIELEWNEKNETMSGSGTNWYLNKTGLANSTYTYRIWTNDSFGNMNVSETRVVSIAYSPPPPDTTPPTIIIQSPVTRTYRDKIITLNYMADEPLGMCFVLVDATANTTLPSCENQSVISREYENTIGIVGWWHFNEGSGSTAEDSSRAGNSGTLINNPAWVDGRFGKALSYDGSDDYAEVNGSELGGSNEITIETWIKPVIGTRGAIVARYLYNYTIPINDRVYVLSINGSGNVEFALSSNGTEAGAVWLTSNNVVSNNTWTHIAATSDGSTMKIFINGEQDLSTTAAPSTIHSTDDRNLQIGAWRYGVLSSEIGTYFNGIIDEVRILNRSLKADEIKADYALGEGSHSITIYANDTAGNWNSTTVYFTVFDKFFRSLTPANGSIVDSDYIYINVTLSEAPGWIALEWNGNNETMEGSGTNRYLNKTNLENGDYSFKVWATDSFGNMNVSETRVVTVGFYSQPLFEGWNNITEFMGYNNTPVEDSLSSVDYTIIWELDDGSNSTRWSHVKGVGGDFSNLTSGEAYRIYVNSNTTWTYPVP